MRLRSPLTALVVLVFLGPSVGASPAPPPPAAVAALTMSPGASLLAWTPVTGAQGYAVYGQTSTGLVFLFNTDLTSTPVSGTYETFAVASLMDGVPSSPQYVTAGTCVYPDFDVPPSVFIGNCGTATPTPSIWLHAP